MRTDATTPKRARRAALDAAGDTDAPPPRRRPQPPRPPALDWPRSEPVDGWRWELGPDPGD